jgi:hypothetical protein
MANHQSAACVRCDKNDCAAVVILPALPDNAKKFEADKQRLDLVCPACHRFFAVSVKDVEVCDVSDEDLNRRFFTGHFVRPGLVQ